jgi:hypothetical protein
VRLGRGNEQADLARAVARLEVGERALDRFHVGAGRLVENSGSSLERFQQIGSIGELRNHPGVGVRRRLDARKPERREALDQRALGRGRHERGLVLQPVAREALAQRHVGHS